MKLLEITSTGQWRDLSRNNTNIPHDDFTSVAVRRYQETVLKLSAAALENIERERRDHSSMMMAVQRDDIPVVKLKLKTFRQELTAFLERDEVSPNDVYLLALSFFPVTKNLKENP